jgi:hypothetical protein
MDQEVIGTQRALDDERTGWKTACCAELLSGREGTAVTEEPDVKWL